MHATFTGNSRRVRQVDLSGRRTTNPWASSSSGTTPSNAVISAQQQRQKRLHEQAKLAATKTLQKRWRGISARRQWRDAWRQEWDLVETSYGSDAVRTPYRNPDEFFRQVNLLLQFFNINIQHDLERLRLLLSRQSSTLHSNVNDDLQISWLHSLLRLQRLILSVIENQLGNAQSSFDPFLIRCLAINISIVPRLTASNAIGLFRTLALFLQRVSQEASIDNDVLDQVILCISGVFGTASSDLPAAYEVFVEELLTLPDLCNPPLYPRVLDSLASFVDCRQISSAILRLHASKTSKTFSSSKNVHSHALILAYMLYLQQHSRLPHSDADSATVDFVSSVSILLASLAADRSRRSNAGESMDEDLDGSSNANVSTTTAFTQKQILSLIDDRSILSIVDKTNGSTNLSVPGQDTDRYAKQLASFALTLLRVFPEKADDIRMQLYRGSSTLSSIETAHKSPAILYFWRATKATTVFRSISRNLDASIALLKVDTDREVTIEGTKLGRESIQDDWRVILIFFELYVFVLRVMDDQEFFSRKVLTVESKAKSWASQNALPLEDVKLLSNFLKNLGFAMYYNASTLSGFAEIKRIEPVSLSHYFNPSSSRVEDSTNTQQDVNEFNVAGMTDIAVDYAKSLVTNLLRMLYERDSRRPFLPKDHWLMTSHLRMDGFISSVVEEDENRRRFQEDEQEEETNEDTFEEDERDNIIGTSRTSRLRRQRNLQAQQRRLARKRFLAGITPRLEIMQHMPFFIPFETRVEIFREFIKLDQLKRRNGVTDADQWRFMSMANPDMLKRHHASIRREHVFTDAMSHFWSLGEGFKEPIQITFIDAYNNEEAGIDGGGVTKEFLTSIIQEAFEPHDLDNASNAAQLFVENHEHKLYPNPTALDETYEALNRSYSRHYLSTHENLQRMQEQDILKRYEFIGRIIGKCLYEGILVDVAFAGFFLLKWALAGGDGAASRKTSYRANFNELRDLDEDLYRGLLQLKNYPGDVADFGLDFTINDRIVYDHKTGAHITKTTNLRAHKADEPVTNANRLLYISYVAAHRLQVQPARQTAAFLQGLSAMIKPRWLNMFNQSELQTLVGGTSASIDVADLRNNTECSGVFMPGTAGEHRTIKLFWEVMHEFDDEQRRAVIKFVTSTPRAPLLGFKTLSPRFTIRDSGSDQTRLPSTSTCVNLLKLPMYTSKRVLRDKLLQAVFSGAGFDLS